MIPAARTRGPEAQCRALGFRWYFATEYHHRQARTFCVFYRNNARFTYTGVNLEQAAGEHLAWYARYYGFDGGIP